MNQIIEEALTNMIRRIEILESQMRILKSTRPSESTNHDPNSATHDQRKYIRGLGGICPLNMTKAEAGIIIDKLLKRKTSKQKEPVEVDTDNAGLDGDLL